VKHQQQQKQLDEWTDVPMDDAEDNQQVQHYFSRDAIELCARKVRDWHVILCEIACLYSLFLFQVAALSGDARKCLDIAM